MANPLAHPAHDGLEPIGDSKPAGDSAAVSEGEPLDDGDFAGEHERTVTDREPALDADGESESPEGHSGLEPTSRPN